jgi:hypothetical protein
MPSKKIMARTGNIGYEFNEECSMHVYCINRGSTEAGLPQLQTGSYKQNNRKQISVSSLPDYIVVL